MTTIEAPPELPTTEDFERNRIESMERFYGLIVWGMKRAGIRERKLNLDMAHDLFCDIYRSFDGRCKITTYVLRWLPGAICTWMWEAAKEDAKRQKHVEPKAIKAPEQDEPLSHEELERISYVLESLHEREREVLSLYFGLADGYEYTFSDIGRRFNVTSGRVHQIHLKARGRFGKNYWLRQQWQENREAPVSYDTIVSVILDRTDKRFAHLRVPIELVPEEQRDL